MPGYTTGTYIGFGSIAAVYAKPRGKFWPDLAAVLPLELLTPLVACTRFGRVAAIAMLRLNRCVSFISIIPRVFRYRERSHQANIPVVRTLKFTLYIYAVTHCCACVLYWWACAYRPTEYVR